MRSTFNLPTMKARDAGRGIATAVNMALYGGERVVLTRRGRAVAAIVSIEDLAKLEQGAAPARSGDQERST